MKYVVDSRYFDGSCLTSMSDGIHSDYGGSTLEELRECERNSHLVVVPPERISLLMKRYLRSQCKPFEEITEERYYDLLDCLPPARMGNGWFYVGEPYCGDLYPFCFKAGGRFYKGERPVRMKVEEISRQIKAHVETVNRHPALVKGVPFLRYDGQYGRMVTCIPYYFRYEHEKYFLTDLITRTGTETGDREHRREMAGLLAGLRRHYYRYCTFHSVKEDIFEFFKWIRDNKYTLQVQGELFNFAPDRSYVDFHGNVRECSAAFRYRIYSRELFCHIINQLRTVKRYHVWRKKTEIQ